MVAIPDYCVCGWSDGAHRAAAAVRAEQAAELARLRHEHIEHIGKIADLEAAEVIADKAIASQRVELARLRERLEHFTSCPIGVDNPGACPTCVAIQRDPCGKEHP